MAQHGTKTFKILHCLDSWGECRFKEHIHQILNTDYLEDKDIHLIHQVVILGSEKIQSQPANFLVLDLDVQSLGPKLRNGYGVLQKEIEKFSADCLISYSKWSDLVSLPAAFYSKVRFRVATNQHFDSVTYIQKTSLNYVRKNFSNFRLNTQPWKDKNPQTHRPFYPSLSESDAVSAEPTKNTGVAILQGGASVMDSGMLEEISKELQPDVIYWDTEENLQRAKTLISGEGIDLRLKSSEIDTKMTILLTEDTFDNSFFFRVAKSGSVPIVPATEKYRYFIASGENGFLYSPGDIFTLKELCRNLSEDMIKLQGLGRAAQSDFKKKWCIERQTDTIMSFVTETQAETQAETQKTQLDSQT